MIARHYIEGVKIEGLDVSTNGLQLTIQPGSLEVAGNRATLTQPVTLDFPPTDVPSDIMIGFDGLGRLFVDRRDRGKAQEQPLRFGVIAHYVWFTLPPDVTDLADVVIYVLWQAK